jgi:N-acetylglutamate synthase-like GNAT family acetyltransferase
MVSIRKATLHDAESVIEVLSRYYNFENKDEALQIFHREYSLHYHFRVAVEGDEILGVVSWRMHGLPKHGIAKLKRIAVLPDSEQRSMVLEMLYDAALADMDYFYRDQGYALRKVYMMVPGNNQFLHAFVRDHGMHCEARLHSHYYEGRDEYMYSLFMIQHSPMLSGVPSVA